MDTNLLNKFDRYTSYKDYSSIYKFPVRVFLNYCNQNNFDIFNLTFNNLSDFILELKKSRSNGTINNYIQAIKFFFKFLGDTNEPVQDSVIGELEKVKQLKSDRKIKYTITKNHLDFIIKKAVTYSYPMSPFKIKAILYFMFYTGVRRGELINLSRIDIDLQKGHAIIRVPTKNRREREVYFPNSVSSIISKYFSTEREKINAFNLSHARLMHFFNFLKNFDKQITAHTLRHSFTLQLMRKGISERIAQELLGHNSIRSTMIYYQPTKEIVKKIYRTKFKS